MPEIQTSPKGQEIDPSLKDQETESSLSDQLGGIIGLVSRRRWHILAPAVLTSLAVVAVLYQLPNRYTSEATLYVIEQQVPERYVAPTTTTELVDALPTMTQEVLSRSRLLELAEQYDLYAPKRRRLSPEAIDGLMRQDINIEPLPPASGRRDSNAFKISFTASKAVLAQEITSKLTSLFIQENVRTREDQARNTTSFLGDRLEAARQKLSVQEGMLRDFKTKYLGELPEQQQGNLAMLSGAQMQLHNISLSLDRAQQQRIYLESLLNEYRRLKARRSSYIAGIPGVTSSGPEPARPLTPYETAQSELLQLQAKRAQLLIDLQPKHPDVLALDRQIAAKQAVVDSLKQSATAPTETAQAKAPESPQAPPPVTLESEEDSSINQLKNQLESNRVEITILSKDEAQQKSLISDYQSRLNLTPVREQELAGILRDYELSKQEYGDLLKKEQQSQLAMSLEKQQAGQQFRLVEPPSLPAVPSNPKRLKTSFGGIGGGLFLGLIVAMMAEFRNPAFYTEREISRRFAMPLVVGLPLLLTRKDKRRTAWRKSFEWLGGTALVFAVLIAEYWVYRHP
jgi:polysaccharide chain length determinant protein (PEP-CTERM system associated)